MPLARGRPLPRRRPLTGPLAALPGSAALGTHLTLITISCGETMEPAGLGLRNRLNPAEIQVSWRGTGRTNPHLKAASALTGTLPVPPRKAGEQAAVMMGLPLSPGARIYAG